MKRRFAHYNPLREADTGTQRRSPETLNGRNPKTKGEIRDKPQVQVMKAIMVKANMLDCNKDAEMGLTILHAFSRNQDVRANDLAKWKWMRQTRAPDCMRSQIHCNLTKNSTAKPPNHRNGLAICLFSSAYVKQKAKRFCPGPYTIQQCQLYSYLLAIQHRKRFFLPIPNALFRSSCLHESALIKHIDVIRLTSEATSEDSERLAEFPDSRMLYVDECFACKWHVERRRKGQRTKKMADKCVNYGAEYMEPYTGCGSQTTKSGKQKQVVSRTNKWRVTQPEYIIHDMNRTVNTYL
ncbi:hypothetical protein CAPTEDRAFT_207918 [Capitella teleta]|uniref:Uncharacterized protein n=1 Tax=Capitella teleta TaxID=283909 RepID=R7VLG3_CAPTE|nr:hypothetical protein CAPTEDRAFT_207918 [Capitella teleta]|eukprot:ELU17605.1 hypothetical protein CAPTEDRAFT_207918 [Capitella teleta]